MAWANSRITTKTRREDQKKVSATSLSELRILRAFVVRISIDTSGRAKNTQAFARVEDVALRPSQDFGLAIIHGTSQANACAFFVLPDVLDAITVIYTLARETLRTTVFEDSRALRKFTYHHEGHEEHEVRNEISTNLLTFVAFVLL